MKAILLFFSICLGSLLMMACEKDDATTGVFIRVRNDSPYRMENVYVNTSGGENAYGTLEAGRSSEYREFQRAYSYAYITCTVNGQPVAIQPIDYVGETPLDPGQYTYVLGVADLSTGRATLHLE